MKFINKKIASAIALSALMAGNAFAIVPQGDLNRAVGSALSGDSNVLVVVNGDTAILTGTVEGTADADAANRAALAFAGIDKVIDHTVHTH